METLLGETDFTSTQVTRPSVTPPVDDDDMDLPVPIASLPSLSRPTQPANANTNQMTESVQEVED